MSRTKYKISGPGSSGTQDQGVTEIEVTAWAAGGRGVARLDGRVFLVSGAAPGDRVRARIVRDHGRWVEARCEEILRASPHRRTPPCSLQGDCGGCPLMVVDESRQREAKRLFVSDALQRIGGVRDVAVGETRPGGDPLHHRSKVELTFGLGPGGNPILGYHRAGSPGTLVDVPSCAIADPRLGPLLERTRSYFLTGEGRLDPAFTAGPEPIRLVLRASSRTGETLIALRGPDRPFRSAEPFARFAMDAVPALVGVVRILAPPGRRGGARVLTLAGRPWLEEALLGSTFHVPAGAFLQVNAAAGEALGQHVVSGAGAPPSVLELYGGVGAIGLALARAGSQATIVDADPEAVACGQEAAARAGIGGAEFVRSDVLRFLEGEGADGAAPHLVVADPPRTGLGRGVARRIAATGSRRIAMVSCDPATLARDLAALTALGFRVDEVTPFDLFPQTAHVEAVAWLSRD